VLLYQQPLGWQLQFYLYTPPGQSTIEARWFANALTLADNAAKNPAHRRYLIHPTWRAIPDLNIHLATRNIVVTQQKRFGEMIVYAIADRPQLACRWCRCQTPHPNWAIRRDLPTQQSVE
jgi:hypothetical protein